MTTLAAALLRDVPRNVALGVSMPMLAEDHVIKALSAALDPALSERTGEVLERLSKLADDMDRHATEEWDESELLCNVGDTIRALLAQNAALRAERDREAKAHEKEIYVWSENYAGLERKLTAAEAQIAALTARVERLTGALVIAREWVYGCTRTGINQDLAEADLATIDAALSATPTTEEGHE